MRGFFLSGLMLTCLLFSGPAHADERPSDRNLVLAGMAMGIPTYMLGVALHEGSHALAGKMVGARVTDYSLIPGFHPRTDKFYFGYVTVHGLRSQKQRAWFLIAPKVTDTILLSGFSLLYATDSMPSNHYGQTAVLVLATGFWVDFSKDIFAFWDHNDTVKVYKAMGLESELARLPARLVHLGLSIGMGYAIYRGYDDLFSEPTESMAQPLLVPMWDQRF
jgi:hypothetical protein